MGLARSRIANDPAERYYSEHRGLRVAPRRNEELSVVSTTVEAPDPTDLETLQVKKVDLDIKNNTQKHHTNEYDITVKQPGSEANELLVLRRGQPFDIAVDFNRQYDKSHDDLRIICEFGARPKASRRSHVEFVLSDKDTPNKWGGWIKSSNGNSTVISIMTPPECYVGKWKLNIDILKKKDNTLKAYRYKHKDHFYILFNPWCKDDSVYMADDDLRHEYVLEESGQLYYGATGSQSYRDWTFGQFEDCVLDTILSLLERNMNDNALDRGNAINVSRALSKVTNQSDDNGIVVGNWSGEYGSGVSPLTWSGSYAILEQYHRTNKPVRYGQCWVFSGVLTTACRAVGIPCRSISNFSSAHDTNGSLSIDYHYYENGDPVDRLNGDSIWNFHVWNDAWMARPDLPEGYGGWQAIDATPQETSYGVYCCGPAPVKAIKNGEVNLGYDGPFIFSEVNGDRVTWELGDDGKLTIESVAKGYVGKNISTKMPGQNRREYITDQYKHSEGTTEERNAVQKANLYSSKPRDFVNPVGDVDCTLKYDNDTKVGDDLMVELYFKNNANTTRTVNGTFNLASTFYTGVHVADILKERINKLELKPNAEKTIPHKLTLEEYLKVATDNFQYRAVVHCKVEETRQVFADMLPIVPIKPHLIIKVPATVIVDQKFTVEASFQSNLNVTLEQVTVTTDVPGTYHPKTYGHPNVEPRGTFNFQIDMVPWKVGKRAVVVEFNSKQLQGITGAASVLVVSK